MSEQSFPNTSSTNNSGFSYIIPYGQTQDCDIYGPICQTGSITVGIISATTTTVLPCSFYLSAQSTHLAKENSPDGDRDFWENHIEDTSNDTGLVDWDRNFGQSPECRSYAEAMSKGQYTFSGCGSKDAVIQSTADLGFDFDYPLQIPPGLARFFTSDYRGTCCGNCSVVIPEVRLYYFPDKTNNCHDNQTANFTSTSLTADGSTAILSGHTFTSPSVYLQLMGTAAVHDLCTSVGQELINPIITLAPGELSTWSPVGIDSDSYTAGEIWEDPSAIPDPDDPDAFEDGIAPLEIQDLACPTFGLGISTSADGTVITTVGPPWLPLVVPPMNIFSLDPIWAALCTGVLGDSWGQTAFALFDPPIALTPVSSLLPTPKTRPTPTPVPIPAGPTTVPERATPPAGTAEPASLPNDPVSPPVRTGDPAASLPPDSVASPQNKGDPSSDPPSDSPTDPKVYPVSTIAGDPLAGSPAPSSSTRDPPSDNPDISPTDPKVPVFPLPGEDAQPQSQGLGAIIYNAFGNPGPEVDGSSTVSLPPQSTFTIGSQTFTVNPTGFEINTAAMAPGGTAHIVDGTTISLDQSGFLAIDSSAFQIAGTIVSEGGPAATIDGTVVSLGQSGALAVGSSTVHLPTLSDTSSNIYTVAGQTFTPNPSAFQIAGTMVSEGGPAATIDGTVVSLGQSGALAIGSSTVHLPMLSDTPSNVYTLAGQRFTPNPSVFTIAGTVISAGGPAAVIDGTTVSLEPSGTLLVGSSTIPLLSPQGPSETDIDGFDVEAQSSFVIVDGTTLSAAAAGVTISGKVFSLEAGGSTLDIGTGRFALPTTQGAANGSVSVQAFMGGQSKRFDIPPTLICGVCGFVVLSVVAVML